jgi:hypothetical protein
VGDGRSIKVWGDRWVPVPSTYRIKSPCNNLPEDALVADLIDNDIKGWKTKLINETFNEDEAKVMLNIPLRPLLPWDRLIWRGTANGEFSVRSAYLLAGFSSKTYSKGSRISKQNKSKQSGGSCGK